MYNHVMAMIREIELPQGLRLRLIHGDITHSEAEAIVNAANARLQHGGGVAAAIARGGGPQIQAESDAWLREHGPISHETPAITSSGELPCQYVIHAVGPVWGEGNEHQKLTTTVQYALRLADEQGIQSLALPAISTGIYGFPKEQGAGVILDALLKEIEQHPPARLRQIDITLIDEQSVKHFATAFEKRWGTEP
jgi:O-acetyl-ADP-ribose deacetylase (regulator of RNase III)